MKKIFPLLILSCITVHLKAQSKFEREKNLLDSISVSLNLKKNDPFMYGIKEVNNSNKQFISIDTAKTGQEMDSCFCHCSCSYLTQNPATIWFFKIESLRSDKFRVEGETLVLISINSKGKEKEIPVHFDGMTQGEKIKNWFTELTQLCKE